MESQIISSIEELIEAVRTDFSSWDSNSKPWFRGEPKAPRNELKPKLYRYKNGPASELTYLRQFRNQAPHYMDFQIPQSGQTDQWMFLAQHVGLRTRILDWTEGLLVALYFALNHTKKGSVVWMLDPVELNRLTEKNTSIDDPLTWFSPELDPVMWIRKLLEPDQRYQTSQMASLKEQPDINYASIFLEKFKTAHVRKNIGNMNIRAAWEAKEELGTKYPVAIHPTSIHPRISLQLSRFTIWGSDKRNLSKMVATSSNILKKYEIVEKTEDINSTLRLLGISRVSLFSDLDSLAFDLQKKLK